ncbi:hypothetical protein CR513_24408, partial [Mucuna pruriens]
MGASTVELSSSISQSNTLLVHSLSNTILLVGQATIVLNCMALMTSSPRKLSGMQNQYCTTHLWGKTEITPIVTLSFGPSFIWIHEAFSSTFILQYGSNNGVFVNHQFHAYFQTHALVYETSCPHIPQQNRVANRKNRHIIETVRALLVGSHAPNKYWEDAISTTLHLIYQLPTKALNFSTSLQALARVTWNEDLKWWNSITKSEDSTIGVIGHRKDNNSPEVVHEVRSFEPSLDENFDINIWYKLPFRHNKGYLNPYEALFIRCHHAMSQQDFKKL